VTDKVSHSYKTTGKVTFLYILIFRFANWRHKIFWTDW